jgi:hypothetical protein
MREKERRKQRRNNKKDREKRHWMLESHRAQPALLSFFYMRFLYCFSLNHNMAEPALVTYDFFLRILFRGLLSDGLLRRYLKTRRGWPLDSFTGLGIPPFAFPVWEHQSRTQHLDSHNSSFFSRLVPIGRLLPWNDSIFNYRECYSMRHATDALPIFRHRVKPSDGLRHMTWTRMLPVANCILHGCITSVLSLR